MNGSGVHGCSCHVHFQVTCVIVCVRVRVCVCVCGDSVVIPVAIQPQPLSAPPKSSYCQLFSHPKGDDGEAGNIRMDAKICHDIIMYLSLER